MSLIYEKNVIPLHPFAEKPFQPGSGRKGVIIISHHRVCKGRNIQAESKGADLILLRPVQQLLPPAIVLILQKCIHRLIYPVIMSPGVRTVFRVTLGLLQGTNLLLRRQEHPLQPKALLLQNGKGISGRLGRHRPGRQVEKLLSQPFPKRLHRRKNHRHGLPHPRRRLDKQPLPPADGPVNRYCQLPLALAVRKGECQRPGRSISRLLPGNLEIRPFPIGLCQRLHPRFQHFHRKIFTEIADLLRLQIHIGHLHPHLLPVLLYPVQIRIAFGLGQMQLIRLFHLVNVPVYPFDLIHRHRAVRFRHNPICPAFHDQIVSLSWKYPFQRNLCLIIAALATLYLPMDPSACQHRFLIHPGAAMTVVNIALPQNKFHKVSHRNPHLPLFHPCSSFPVFLCPLYYEEKFSSKMADKKNSASSAQLLPVGHSFPGSAGSACLVFIQ